MDAPISIRRPGSETPPFQRIGIVGLGLIGGSIARALRRWSSLLLIGVDSKARVEQASVAHAIDVGADDLGMLSDAELIVLAAPVAENIKLLEHLPNYVQGEAIITDVSSTKQAIAEAAQRLPARLPFVPGHPLAGAAVGGFANANPDLFDGRPWLLCPSDESALTRVVQFVRALGAAPRMIEPSAHDRLLAFLSHLPQLTVSALMQTVGNAVGEDGLALGGRGLQDTTRLASSPADIWAQICATNRDEIGPALDALIATLQELRANLGSDGAITEVFQHAQHWRGKIKSQNS